MDWSKAKTILIISFTFLNILLGYQLWMTWNEQSRANVVSSQTVEELHQLLAAERIKLEDTLPTDLQKMGYLQAEVIRQDEAWHALKPSVDISPVMDGKDSVTEELKSQIDHLSKYKLDEAALKDGEWIYYQLVADFPVFVSPIELKREGNQLTAYRQIEVEITAREKTNIVVSPHAALKSAVETQLIPPESTIKEVRLGYTGQLNAEEPQFLVPVWRIETSGKDLLYVNALTGGIESDNWPIEQE